MASQGPPSNKPKPKIGPLQRREVWLAYFLLLPTFLVVFAIILFPLLSNFWISFKPVALADLRSPRPIVRERVSGQAGEVGEKVTLEYRIRNSSQKKEVTEVMLSDTLIPGLSVMKIDERCEVIEYSLNCDLGTVEPKQRERIVITLEVGEEFLASPQSGNLKALTESVPVVTGESDNVLLNLYFTLENYVRMIDDDFYDILKVTFYYTFFGTFGALLLGLIAAQLLFKSFPGRGLLRGIFLFPYVAPVISVAFTWTILFDPFSGTFNVFLQEIGLIETPINFFGQRVFELRVLGFAFEIPLALSSVIAFEVWRYFPLSFLFILARMQSIPQGMYEAAEMDGATPFQQFFYISLPQLMGILGVLFLLRFIWTFNKFDDIFLLTGGGAGTRTMTVDVYEQGFAISNLGAGAAVATLIFIILLSFSILFIKLFPSDK